MKELAEHLKSERLERGLSLEAVSKETGISSKMLESLEKGDLDRLGASFLVRGYIRSYCRVLGIDPAPLLEKHASDIAAEDRQQEYIARYAEKTRFFRVKRRMGMFTLLFLGVATVALLAAGTWISERRARLNGLDPAGGDMMSQQELPEDLTSRYASSRQTGEEKERSVELKPEPEADKMVSAEVVSVEIEVPSAQPVPQTAEPAATARQFPMGVHPTEVLAEDRPPPLPREAVRNVFSVDAIEKTWVQVRIDDRHTQSAMLQPGDRREWQADKGMQIVIGNAGGVHMKWNGKPVDNPGKSGKVLRFSLPDPQIVKE